MKFKLLLLLLLFPTFCFGQDILVQKVRLTNTISKTDVSEIPKVTDWKNADNPAVKKMNAEILERFDIESFVQKELDEFRWSDVTCGSEMKGDMLYIWFKGSYYGAYPTDVEDEFYFDVKTGDVLTLPVIPFQALFTLSGYLDFMNKYWLAGVKKEFKEAVACAEDEPLCSYYDIQTYAADNGKLSVKLNSDCYPHVSRGCSPIYDIAVPLEEVKPYLNEVGKYILASSYQSKSTLEKFAENKRLQDQVPNHLFLFGKINNKYPFSMALHVDKQNQITGFYYYDNKLQKLDLKGQTTHDTFTLTESYKDKVSGFFELKRSATYDDAAFSVYDPAGDDTYLSGKWMNLEKTKVLPILFNAVKLNDRN